MLSFLVFLNDYMAFQVIRLQHIHQPSFFTSPKTIFNQKNTFLKYTWNVATLHHCFLPVICFKSISLLTLLPFHSNSSCSSWSTLSKMQRRLSCLNSLLALNNTEKKNARSSIMICSLSISPISMSLSPHLFQSSH